MTEHARVQDGADQPRRPVDRSWLWEASNRPSGVSWWGELPTWIRHAVYWLIALALLALAWFDTSTSADVADRDAGGTVLFLWFFGVFFVSGVIAIVREWDFLPILRSLSRLLVLLALLLGGLTGVLVLVKADVVSVASGAAASPRLILEMLTWHAADVVPALEIPDSVGWERPATSSDPFAGPAVVIVRAFVAIIVLAGIKRLWDRWLGSGERPTRSDLSGGLDRLTHARSDTSG